MNEELSMDQKLRRLNHLVREIEDAKAQKEQKVGERIGVLKDLKNRFDLDSLEQISERMANLEVQLSKRKEKVDRLFKKISDRYEL